MNRLTMSLAVVVFFLNPGIACTTGPEADYKYGEAEMRSAVEGTWALTLAASDVSSDTPIILQVTESRDAQPDQIQAAKSGRGLIRHAAACGTRTFVASVQACIDSSEMPLDVELVSGPDAYKDAVMSGRLSVYSLLFSQGSLSFTLGDLHVSATIAPDGTVSGSLTAQTRNGGAVPVLTLVRTAK